MPKKTLVSTSLSKKDSHIDVRTVGSLTMTRMSKENPVKEHNLHSSQILRVSRALSVSSASTFNPNPDNGNHLVHPVVSVVVFAALKLSVWLGVSDLWHNDLLPIATS